MQITVYFKSIGSNKILEFVKIYAIISYRPTNNEKLLLLIKEVVTKVIYLLFIDIYHE